MSRTRAIVTNLDMMAKTMTLLTVVEEERKDHQIKETEIEVGLNKDLTDQIIHPRVEEAQSADMDHQENTIAMPKTWLILTTI